MTNHADSGGTAANKITVMPVGLATAHEKFLLDCARESYKAAPALFNDVLGKVLTLSAALTGGGLALLDKAVMPGWGKVVTLSFFLGGVAACLTGLFPVGGKLVMSPAMIRGRLDVAIRHKKKWLRLACASLVIGFIVAIVACGVQAY